MTRTTSGFALIEVIITIVLLAGAVTGATSLVMTAGNAVQNNQNRLTATYLAQECLELARNARDSSWKQNLPWDCAFEQNAISECQEINDLILPMVEGEEGVVILGEPTHFMRNLITSVDSSSEEALQVECTVSWVWKSKTQEVKISELLTNWHKK